MGLPVVRTGNVALDRFLEQVREYIEASRGNGNPQSKDRVLRVSDLPAMIELAAAGARRKAGGFTQSEVETLARDIKNTRVFQSLMGPGSALGGVVDGLPRKVLADVRAEGSRGRAGVTSEAIVSVTDTQAIAAQVTTVEARLDDFDGAASIEVAYLALVDRLDGAEAQYTIKVRAGGAIAGIGLAASDPGEGGATSSVVISADKFAVVSAGSSGLAGAKVPFTINTGTGKIEFTADVAINGGLIVSGTVDAGAITSGNLALTGGNFTAAGGLMYATGVAGSGNGTIEAYTSGETAVRGWSYAAGGQGVFGYASDLNTNSTGVHGQSLFGPGLRCTGKFRWGSYTWDSPTGTGTTWLCNNGNWSAPTAEQVGAIKGDGSRIELKWETIGPGIGLHVYVDGARQGRIQFNG